MSFWCCGRCLLVGEKKIDSSVAYQNLFKEIRKRAGTENDKQGTEISLVDMPKLNGIQIDNEGSSTKDINEKSVSQNEEIIQLPNS